MLLEQLKLLFSGMSVATIVCVLLGIMLVVVEFFQPTHYLVGGIGLGLIGCGCVLRILGNGNVGMLFLMVLFVCVVLLLFHMSMMLVQKRDWLTHSLSLLITKDELLKSMDSYSALVGKMGVTTTAINLSGNMSIADTNYFVYSAETIERNEKVIVAQVDGNKIIVKKYN